MMTDMKNINKILMLGLLSLVLSLSSCDSWLSVTPSDRLSEDMLFDSRDGYVKALNGIYIELVSDDLYGRNLSVGAVDVMAQYYNAATVSSNTFAQLAKLTYTNTAELNTFNSIWTKAYSLIANCNTILEKCEADKGTLTEPYKSMIKGEALALRAMLHFDLMRLFGPMTSELTKESIPYQTSSSLEITSLLTGTEVMQHITDDLTSALALLKTSDPYLATDKSLYSTTDVTYRQFRLNYYAVKALLARAYLWENDKTNAYQTAKDLIEECQTQFPFVTKSAATSTSAPDRVFSSEVLFSLYNSTRTDVQDELFAPSLESTKLLTFAGTLSSGRVNELYDDKNDYRYKIWATYNDNGTSVIYHRKFEDVSTTASFKYMMPLIRMGEMYLIVAECSSDMTEASSYFNQLRNARNCFSIALSESNLLSTLASEYKKEMLGEGQLFFFYKRQAMVNIPDGSKASGNKNVELVKYVIPLPESETSQRNSGN
jgi:hypothetical protein